MSEVGQLNPTAAQSGCVLFDHAVHGLFHLDLDLGSIDKVERALRVHTDQVQAMQTRDLPARLRLCRPQPGLHQALWEPFDGKGMALDDFYPHVRQILGGKAEETTVCTSLGLRTYP